MYKLFERTYFECQVYYDDDFETRRYYYHSELRNGFVYVWRYDVDDGVASHIECHRLQSAFARIYWDYELGRVAYELL